jgi:pilin isopeptide linkage protein/LPXTG-motif cell wall-anchored protein
VTIDIAGEKTWDLNGKDPVLPGSITLNAKNGDIIVATVVVTPDDSGRWTYTFLNLPKYDTANNEVHYTIEELPVESWRSVADGYDIQNKYIIPADFTPYVEKRIEGDTPDADAQFRFILIATDGAPLPAGSASGSKTISVTGAGTADFGVISFTAPGTYVYTVYELYTGAAGYTYDPSTYTLTVVSVEEDHEIVITGTELTKNETDAEEIVFTNGYEKPGEDEVIITGSKRWIHGDNPIENQPKSLRIYVKDGDRVVADTIVSEENHWQWSFELPKYHDDGSVIYYTIDEDNVEGYTKTVDGYNLINTYDTSKTELITLSGTKTWNYGNAPQSERPSEITVLIKNGDKTVMEIKVTEAESWKWSVVLPKFDQNGEIINYTVDEANVANYTHTVNGTDITNTYLGTDYPGDSPKTGDNSNMLIWILVMLLSLAGLIFTLNLNNKQKNKGMFYKIKHIR